MANQASRWRTAIEVAAISAVVYTILGAPGFPSGFLGSESLVHKTPQSRAKTESLVFPSPGLHCDGKSYDMHIFSTNPLVIYIDDFLSQEETEHLINISHDKWQISTVFNNGVEERDDSVRKSEKALIERDNIVQCIEQRALSIQGWPQETFIERLWTQRYNVSGHYSLHYDWASASKESRRVSTFMVYLDADCEGGGTNFPMLKVPEDSKWCDFIECGPQDSGIEGVTFRARKGAAVFWMNFDADGRGYKETIHAGMPVTKGTKIGLNIWSWYQAGLQIGD